MNKIICGDCIDVMKSLEADSIDTIITDPPYGLSFMGKKWDYDVPGVETWKECLRVLKPGGTALIFAGSRTQHRMAVAVEDAGFILKDCIMWLYGSGFPKAHDIGKSVEKIKVGGIKNLKQIGTKKGIKVETRTQGYSYNKEYVAGKCMGGKQISGEIPVYEINNKWNGWKSHGLKPAYEPILVCVKPNDGTYANNALKHGVSGLNIDGGRIGTEIRKTKGAGGTETTMVKGAWGSGKGKDLEFETTGRFPANILLDEEAAKQLGEPSRFFYVAKASKSERTCNGLVNNNHPTVKSLKLMEYLCILTKTPSGGIVLDPFLGSGTTAMACKKTGRPFIGIEKEPEYVRIAEARIKAVVIDNKLPL